MVFIAAVRNSSSNKNLDMNGVLKTIINQYSKDFGDGFEIKIRVLGDNDELQNNESLIDIVNQDKIEGNNGNDDGEADEGGKYIKISSSTLSDDGSMKQGVNNRYHGHVFSHEIGHTGGLSHPFEMGIQDTYTNGGIVNNKYQSIMLDATSDNFMNYPVKAYEALAHKNFYNAEEMNQILYKFTTKPSPATPTQKLQIRDNYLKGVLNFNDIPK